GQQVAGMRVAWSPTLGYAKPSPEVLAITERAAKSFESLGCRVDLIEKVFDQDPEDIWTTEFYGGMRVRFAKQYRESREALDPGLVATLDSLADEPASAYFAKLFRRYELREAVRAFFVNYDLLLTPHAPLPPT